MNNVNNRKMFAKRDARNKLAEMGGILASSPELLGEAQKFANGGSTYVPNQFPEPDRRRLEDSAFRQYGMNLNADNTLSPVARAPSTSIPVKTLEERGFNQREREEILSIATNMASMGVNFDEAIERAVSMFESNNSQLTASSIENDAGLPAIKQTLNSLNNQAGPNSFAEAGIMQFTDPRQSTPIPGMGDLNMTDSASLRAGVVRPDMMPPGFTPDMPSEEMMFSTSPQGGMDALAMESLQKTIDNPSTRTMFGVPLENMTSEKRKIAAQEQQQLLQEGISNLGHLPEVTMGPFASDTDFRGLPSAEDIALENASTIVNDSTSTKEEKDAAQLALYQANVNKTDVERKQEKNNKENIKLEEKRKEEKNKTLEKTNIVTEEKSVEISNLNKQINQLLNGEDIIDLGDPKSDPTPDATPDPVKKDTSLAARNKEMQALYQEMFGEDEKEVAAAKWNQLAMVGFAIAAGKDPDTLTNIAAGLLQGATQTRKDVATRQARKDKIQMSAFESALSQSSADTKFGRDIEIAKLRLEGQGGYLKDESPPRLYNKFLDSFIKTNKQLALEGGFLPLGQNGKPIEGVEALNFIQDQASKQALISVQQTHPDFKLSSPTLNAPPIGTVTEGYKFMGGDPGNKNNWEKV